MLSETEPLLSEHSNSLSNNNQCETSNNLVKLFRLIFNLELAVALTSFAYGLHGIIVTNLYIEKACRVNLNYSTDICNNINQYDKEQNNVQTIVTTLELYSTFLSSGPCIFISMMLGSWSDRNGRKPVLIFSSLGSFMSHAAYILNVYFYNIKAEFLMFSNLYALFGGMTTQLLSIYSILAETTSISSRTSRIAFLHVFTSIGYTSGNFLAPYLYHWGGYYWTFGASSAVHLLGLFIIIISVHETRGTQLETLTNRDQRLSWCRQTSASVKNMKEAVLSVLKQRPGNTRKLLLLLLTIMLLFVASQSGGGGGYLFTRKMFQWDESIYTEVDTVMTVLSTACNLLLLPFLSYTLALPDHIIGLVATMSTCSEKLVTALANTGRSFIFARCLGLLGSQPSLIIRSLISKLVDNSDLGKVYAVLGSLENVIPLAFSPILTYTYNNTLDVYPGTTYAISAAITGIAVLCFIQVSIILEKDQGYVSSQENSQKEVPTSV